MMDSRNRAARRGISLLEVLAAMLVLTIGILGMARLIPVGVYELSQVTKLDGASTLGRASFRDIEVRGYLNPSRWWDPVAGLLLNSTDGSQILGYNWMPPGYTYPHTVTPPFTASPISTTTAPLQFPPAVVIDPLMVTSPGATANMVQTFPYGATADTINTNAPWIPRVNVTVSSNSGMTPMTFALADRIFRSSDEGQYSDPATSPAAGNMRPTMKFNTDASSNRTQSSTLGSDSWFVTVLPTMAETTSTKFNPSYARQFTASVVVCNKRDLTLPPTGPSVDKPPPGERMLTATLAAGGGIGGGDVYLTAPNTNLAEWVNVRPGQWIMLSCFVLVPGFPGDANNAATPAVPRLVADWYRIVGVGDVSGASRWVTVHGADWPTLLTQNQPIFATIVDGVTGVYQKTITLDGSSSWQQ